MQPTRIGLPLIPITNIYDETKPKIKFKKNPITNH